MKSQDRSFSSSCLEWNDCVLFKPKKTFVFIAVDRFHFEFMTYNGKSGNCQN